jgi:hypothetical protein
MADTWSELEAPVLRWIYEHEGADTGEILFRSSEISEIADIPERKLPDAIWRLEEYGLVHGQPIETSGYVIWRNLRITPDGLRVLGEWVGINERLDLVLRAVAQRLAPEEARVVEETAESIDRVGRKTLADVAKGILQRVGESSVS